MKTDHFVLTWNREQQGRKTSRYNSIKVAVDKETISLSGTQANLIGTMCKLSCFNDTRHHTREKPPKEPKPKLVRSCPLKVNSLEVKNKRMKIQDCINQLIAAAMS